MAGAKRIPVTVVKDCNAALRAYVTKTKALAITQADITSITYTITDTSDGSPVSGHNNVTIQKTDVIYDALQTPTLDASWTIDDIGYNFRHVLAGTGWPDTGVIYHYDGFIIAADGSTIPVLFAISVTPVSR